MDPSLIANRFFCSLSANFNFRLNSCNPMTGLIALAGILLFHTPATSRAQRISVDGYAAMVNSRIITVSDIMIMVAPKEAQLKKKYNGMDLRDKLDKAFTDAREALIERALILEDFTAQELTVPDRLVEEQMEGTIRRSFDNNRTSLMEALTREHTTLDQWRESIKDRLSISLLRQREIQALISVSPLAVLQAYQDRIDEFTQPEEIKLRTIVLFKGATPDDQTIRREEAQTIRKRLENEEFALVATETSEGSKAAGGGDWGWVQPKVLNKDILNEIRTLGAGEISNVIEADDTFFIVTIEARKETQVAPFEEVQLRLKRELEVKEEKRLYSDWMAR